MCRWLRTWFFRRRLWRHSYCCIEVPWLCSQEEQHCRRNHWHRRILRIYHIWFLVLSIRSNPLGVLEVGSVGIFRKQEHILVFRNLLGGGISNRTKVLHKLIRKRVLDWCIRCGKLVLCKRCRIWGRHLFRNV